MTEHVAHAETMIAATPDAVWAALTEPASVKQWMMGTELSTDWKVGSPVSWQGEMEGKPYEDKGEVLTFDAPTRLSVTHYSPLMGQPDEPENYHTITYDLSPDGDGDGDGTKVSLSQDGNESAEQAEQFGENWQQMLDSLRKTVEQG